MPNKNNIWYKFFNQTSLKNEEWLDPSDAILKNIENEIYPQKKRRWIIFLIPIALLLVVVPIVIYTMDFGTKQELISEQIENVGNTEIQESGEVVDSKKTIVQKDEVNFEVIGGDNKISLEIEKVDNAIDEKAVENSQSISSIAKKQIQSKKEVVSKKNITQVRQKDLSESTSTIKSSTNPRITSNVNPIVLSGISERAKKPETTANVEANNEKTEEILTEIVELTELSQIPLMPLAFDFIIPDLALEILKEPKLEGEEKKRNPISVITGAAYSVWDFNLNNNYQTALQPADFTSNRGKGFMFFTELQKEFSSKISGSLVLSFEKVNFNSGHNSAIQFDNSLMTDNIDLTMATPLGFISSVVTIDNLATPANSVSDIVVDLNNEHTISNIDFGLQLNYKLISQRKFNVEAIIGPGVSYLSSNKNNLASFTIDNSSYSAGSTLITKDQDQISSVRLHSRLGLNFSTATSDFSSIGLQTMYKSDLKAIYNDGADFNTTLSRFTIGAYYKWQF